MVPIHDIYSKRQKRERGEAPDIYEYRNLPDSLRTNIVIIWREILGDHDSYQHVYEVKKRYERLVGILRREYGCFELPGRDRGDPVIRTYIRELEAFFLKERDVDKALDVVDLVFSEMSSYFEISQEAKQLKRLRVNYSDRKDIISNSFLIERLNESDDNPICELNFRFREHGVGYQFEVGKIIRIDSEYIHTEVVKPALGLLNSPLYDGARNEFLDAHEHYRNGDYKEALNECLKAFESVMKSICDKNGWEYTDSAGAAELIDICIDNGLIPRFWESQYNSLRCLLRDSVPTGRNRLSGHGQGRIPTEVPEYVVSYMIHMTASAIVFLASADESLP